MKKFIIALFLCMSIAVVLPSKTYAHPLLPNIVVDYLNQNPNASEQEINRFVLKNAPEFAKRYKADYILTLLNRDTNFFDNTLDFIKIGIDHILSGPDHLLFLLSLLLIFVSFQHILKLTTTFTIAHSITIISAGVGIVTLNPRITEPIIAFSIAYIAFTSVFLSTYFKNSIFSEQGKSKIAIVFFFGLFHGLGFAGLLKEIRIPDDRYLSSLISFNIGIEIGQMLFVLFLLPFIYLFRDKPWYDIVIKIIALGVTILGVYWGIQRIIG